MAPKSDAGPGDALALIAEGQRDTRADLSSGRAAVFGYLMATDAGFSAFEPTWSRSRYGETSASRLGLLGRSPRQSWLAPQMRLPGLSGEDAEAPCLLRIHSWCAAFVDWCVLQLLLRHSSGTTLTLAQRPRTAKALDLLDWGKANGCTVSQGDEAPPVRGDIVVLTFREKHGVSHHTGIVSNGGTGHFDSIEGNTTLGDGGNQGYLVARRRRSQHLLKGFVRLPAKA